MDRVARFIRELSAREWSDELALDGWKLIRNRYMQPGQYDILPPPGGEGKPNGVASEAEGREPLHPPAAPPVEEARVFPPDGRLDGKHGITYMLSRPLAPNAVRPALLSGGVRQGRGWLVPQDSLKTQLILERY